MPPRRIFTRRDWLSAAGLLALSGCVTRSPEEPIWVGHVGPAGLRGESAIGGMQQTLADLREKGFAVSGRSLGVRHVEAEDRTRARAEASRLLAVNRVACLIVGPEVEGVAEVCAIARAHGSIAVVLGGTDDRALSRQAVWLGVGPKAAAEMLARYERVKGPAALGGEGERFPTRIPFDERRSLVAWPARADLPTEGRAWAERYEKRFGKPPDDDAILGADAVAFIAEGLKAAGGDAAKLASEFDDRTDFAGLTGPITWEDWRTRRRMWVHVEKGKRVTTEPVPD